MDDPKYWDNRGVSSETAIEQARDQWQRMYRDNEAAGRETPVVDVPASLGDVARASVEATTELARRGRSRSFIVTIDLAALEAAYQAEQARLAAEQRAAQELAHSKPVRRRTRRPAGG